MEIIDLSKVTLMESGLCSYDSSFLGVLRSNGINYVSQILDDELMNNLFLKLKSSALRTRELKGFISLAKYKYLGIIDPEISRLDESIHIDLKAGRPLSLECVLTLGMRDMDLYAIARNLKKCKDFNPNKKYTHEEILRMVYPLLCAEKTTIRHKRIPLSVKLILEQYDKNKIKDMQDESVDALKMLKEQLVTLTAERDSLNKLIAGVQDKITTIENSKKNGGIKK